MLVSGVEFSESSLAYNTQGSSQVPFPIHTYLTHIHLIHLLSSNPQFVLFSKSVLHFPSVFYSYVQLFYFLGSMYE